jgi:hypothetical protein
MPSPLATLKLFGLAPTKEAFAENVKRVHDLQGCISKINHQTVR